MKSSRADWGLLLLRLGLGLAILFYGAQKLLGVFGGRGFAATTAGMQENLGVLPVLSALAVFAEFFGGLGIIFGLLTPVASFGVMCTMAVASYVTMARPGVLNAMITTGDPMDAHKVLFPALLFFAALALLLTGPGALSLDARIFRGGKGGKK